MPAQASPDSGEPGARRVRRPRAATSGQDDPQTTGATQGGQQRRQGAGGGSPSAIQQIPANRPPPAAEQRRTRPQTQESSARASAMEDEERTPPLPLRRPDFPDAPRARVTALNTPDAPVPDAVAPPATATPSMEAPAAPATQDAQAGAASEAPAQPPAPAVAETAPQPTAAEPEPQPMQAAASEQPAPTAEPVPVPAAATQAPAPAPASVTAEAPAAPPTADVQSAPAAAAEAQSVTPATEAQAATPHEPSASAAAAPQPQPAAPEPAPQAQIAAAEPAPVAQEAPPAPEPAPVAAASEPQPAAPAPVAEPVSTHVKAPAPEPAPSAPAESASAQPIPVTQTAAETPVASETAAPAPAPAAETVAQKVPAPAAPAPQTPAAAEPVREQRVAAVSDDTPPMPQPPARQNGALDRMIGQMLLVGFRGLTPDEAWPQRLAAQIKAGTIGGVLFMSHNIQSPTQLKALTSYLQRAKGEIPALFAVDQEGGIVQRLSAEKGFQTYPTARKIGASNDPLTAYNVYGRLAAELAHFGFNLNLGPVVDLDRNEDSPIIAGKERSFGPQPKHVASFAKAFAVAHQDIGVLTALKHFPGHGSTPFDTHTQAVDIGASWHKEEIEPYRELIAAQAAPAIMVGHISNPAMSEEPGLPASLSSRTIREALRKSLGFNGVVISDDLEMGAIRARYSIEESAVKALKAGNDMIILSNQHAPSLDLPERIIAAVRKAVEGGVLSREDLQASYDRVLALKQRLPGGGAKTAAPSKRASADRGKVMPTR